MLERLIFASAAACMTLAPGAHAQYPDRPIRLIVPFAPGGNVDVTARTVAPALSDLLGRNFVIDNRSGAGGSVGAEIVATAPADGYTLLVGSTGLLSIAPITTNKLRYDPVRSFEPIALLTRVPLVMLVGPKVPAKSVQEFIAIAKTSKGDMLMSSSGNFSTGQLAGALFQNVTGTRLLHVPYKGGSLAMADLIGGHVDVMFDQINAATTHIRNGRVRALALTSASRSPDLPDVPTMAEAGVSGVEAETFNAMLAPAGTPKAIVARLNEVVNEALAMKSVHESYARQGAAVLGGTSEAAGMYIRKEIAKWSAVVKAAGIKTGQN